MSGSGAAGVYAPTFGDPSIVFSLTGQLISGAEGYLAALESAAQNMVAPVINPVFPTLEAAPAVMTAPLPTFTFPAWVDPALPSQFVGSISVTMPAPFVGTPPVANYGTPPTPFSGTIPAAPGIDLNVTMPVPSLVVPNPPSLLTVNAVAFDGVTLPTIDPTLPVLSAVMPSISSWGPEVTYSSGELTFYQAVLQDRITNGTNIGLPPAIEHALWDRDREREYRQMADALADLDRMESMGFAFPPGQYLDARIKLQTEMGNTASMASREIMITQAKTQLDSIIDALKQVGALEAQLIQYYNSQQQRAFEYAKYVTEAGVEIYNAQVKAYEAYVEAYKTRAQIYDIQLKAAITVVDIFKAEVEAQRVVAETNEAIVNQYASMVKAAELQVEIYEAELKGVQTLVDIQRAKIEVYGEQIKAFVGTVNAYTAEVEGYKAQMEGQEIIQQTYKTQVDAYTATVQAAATEANVQIEQLKANIAVNSNQIELYKAEIEGELSKSKAVEAYNNVIADVYKSEVAAVTSLNEVLTKQWQAVIDENLRVEEIAVKAAEANGQLYETARQLSIDGSKAAAQVSGQLGAAALNAFSYHSNASWNISGQQSQSFSQQTSTINEQISSA